MKSKIFNRLNLYKWLAKLDIPARAFIWPFVMILAILTVVLNISIFNEPTRLILLIYLILFFIATSIVFLNEVLRNQIKTSVQETGSSVNIEHAGRYRWISIGLLLLVVIVIGLIFVARQLPPTTQGYQTFFTAFAGVGAWVTGIAIAVFAYQQYKLRQTEHSLLFNPQLILTSGDISFTGSLLLWQMREPYTIKWTVYLQNTSQIPILIQDMNVYVRLVGEESSEQSRLASRLTPRYCHIVEPENLMLPFEVSLTKPYHIMWLVDGSAGDVFDYVSRDSGNRDFVLIFEVAAKRPQDPKESIFFKETTSWGIHVPKDANWVSKTPFPDKLRQE